MAPPKGHTSLASNTNEKYLKNTINRRQAIHCMDTDINWNLLAFDLDGEGPQIRLRNGCLSV